MTIQTGGDQLNIANGIREFARATPRAIAVIDRDRTLTFGELFERAARLAQGLIASGLTPGERVAVLLGNRLEFPEIAAGIAMAGLCMVPLNPRQASLEIAYVLEHSEVKALVMDGALASALPPVLPSVILSIDAGSVGRDYEEFLAGFDAVDPKIVVHEQEPFCVTYTSGTTGKPKGVLISHRSRVLLFYGTALEWGLGPGKRTIAVAPLYHGAGFSFGYGACFTGGTLVMQHKFDAAETLEMVEKHRIQSMFLVPTHAQMMRALGDEAITSRDLSSLHTLYFNAAALPINLKEWVCRMFPNTGVHELYGSTEAGNVANLRPEHALEKPGSVGVPWFMQQVRIVREDGTPVAPGEPGELFSKSPFLMNGYLKDEAATAECTTDDGFLTCGDIATMDDEGFISIVDRKKDMIISGGANIYPREIEEVLLTHPNIADAAVIGVPDETWGEAVVAIVVTRDGTAMSQAEIEAHLRGKVAGYKVPKTSHNVTVLPRNAGGKVLKRDLRDTFTS